MRHDDEMSTTFERTNTANDITDKLMRKLEVGAVDLSLKQPKTIFHK